MYSSAVNIMGGGVGRRRRRRRSSRRKMMMRIMTLLKALRCGGSPLTFSIFQDAVGY